MLRNDATTCQDMDMAHPQWPHQLGKHQEFVCFRSSIIDWCLTVIH